MGISSQVFDVLALLQLCAGAALPSGLSSISQSGWKYLQEDFGIDVVAVPTEQMPAVENAAAIPAYDWLPKREDDQKPEYMAHINKIIPLEDRAGVCQVSPPSCACWLLQLW